MMSCCGFSWVAFCHENEGNGSTLGVQSLQKRPASAEYYSYTASKQIPVVQTQKLMLVWRFKLKANRILLTSLTQFNSDQRSHCVFHQTMSLDLSTNSCLETNCSRLVQFRNFCGSCLCTCHLSSNAKGVDSRETVDRQHMVGSRTNPTFSSYLTIQGLACTADAFNFQQIALHIHLPKGLQDRRMNWELIPTEPPCRQQFASSLNDTNLSFTYEKTVSLSI